MARFATLNKARELSKPKKVRNSKAVDLACDKSGNWRGAALFVYEKEGWTVFEDLSGNAAIVATKFWLAFAGTDDFILAGYNDSISYGQLLAIEKGKITKEFFEDETNPDASVNKGAKKDKRWGTLKSWIDVASFVDEDELIFSDVGFLWIHAVK